MSNTRASNTETAIPQNPDSFAAVCKECGNGTLNNAATQNFRVLGGFDEYVDEIYIQCKACGSRHIDVVVL